jgi:hypothetical protein
MSCWLNKLPLMVDDPEKCQAAIIAPVNSILRSGRVRVLAV